MGGQLQRIVTIPRFLPVSWYGRPLLRSVKKGIDLWGSFVIRARAFNSLNARIFSLGVSPYLMGPPIVNATARDGGRFGR